MSLMLEALDQRRPEEAAAAAPALQPPPPPIGAPEHALAGGYAAAWSPSAETPPPLVHPDQAAHVTNRRRVWLVAAAVLISIGLVSAYLLLGAGHAGMPVAAPVLVPAVVPATTGPDRANEPSPAGAVAAAPAPAASPAKTPDSGPVAPLQAADSTPSRRSPATTGGRADSEVPPISSAKDGAPAARLKKAAPAETSVGAWQLLNQGEFASASQQYQRLATRQPDDADAVLGLATVQHRNGQREAAHANYRRVLALQPDNASAVAGLLQLLGESDPAAAESRLKDFIESQPGDAAPYAALGQLLARQGRWAEAQAALFDAHRLQPGRGVHAFNLAVALDRLHLSRQATDFYTLALGLPQTGEVPQEAVRARLRSLAAPAEHAP
jgi:Flp pilus assembly protein TadD